MWVWVEKKTSRQQVLVHVSMGSVLGTDFSPTAMCPRRSEQCSARSTGALFRGVGVCVGLLNLVLPILCFVGLILG